MTAMHHAFIPLDVWQQPHIRAAINSHHFGRVCSLLREHTLLTQGQIAKMVGIDQAELTRIEVTQQQVTQVDMFFRFVRGLGIPLDLVLPPGLKNQASKKDQTSTISDDKGSIKSGVRVGVPETQTFRQALDDLSALDDQVGGDRLWRTALWRLREVEVALESCRFDDRVGYELHVISGELRRAIGWFSHDSGKLRQARSYFGEALHLSHVTENHFLTTRIIANMTRQTLDLRQGRQTVRLAQKAGAHSGRYVTARIRAVLALREANGWAFLGDKQACETALTRAHHEFDRGISERDPEWVSAYINDEQLTWQEGMCRSDLGQYAQAEKLLEASARQHTDDFRRDLGICLVRLSMNALMMRELDKAAYSAQQATALAGYLMSRRFTSALIELSRNLAPHQNNPAVREALEKLNARISHE